MLAARDFADVKLVEEEDGDEEDVEADFSTVTVLHNSEDIPPTGISFSARRPKASVMIRM